jgi:23S rRNA pseudoU1915 N3-methylase RlmH
MSNEVEFPQIDIEESKGASDSAKAAAKASYDEIFGDLVLASNKAPKENSEAQPTNDKVKPGDRAPEKQLPPLTRFEAHALRVLAKSLSDGDAEATQEMLEVLAEDHPRSIRRVLEELKRIKEASDDLKNLKITWEQGTDRNNQRFVRLYMTKPDSKTSQVEVVIGSDGRNQAIRRNDATGQRENITLQAGLEAVRPVEALRQLSVKQELLREATRRRSDQPKQP